MHGQAVFAFNHSPSLIPIQCRMSTAKYFCIRPHRKVVVAVYDHDAVVKVRQRLAQDDEGQELQRGLAQRIDQRVRALVLQIALQPAQNRVALRP